MKEYGATSIAITGAGAVSPAGWGLSSLRESVVEGREIVPQSFQGASSGGRSYLRRAVPAPQAKSPLFRHPRLRRTSPVGRYLAAAAMEAVGEPRAESFRSGESRLGIVVSCYTGCVNYSQRFFAEVVADPATASPILFPETVFNAPASHLSALFGSSEMNYSLVGDQSQYLTALETAARWLIDDEVDAVLVAAAEESDWLTAEALSLFDGAGVVGEGAAALLLECAQEPQIELALVTDRIPYSGKRRAGDAVRDLRGLLDSEGAKGVLLESGDHSAAFDGWVGDRFALREHFGEGFGVAAGWACALGVSMLQDGDAETSVIGAVGLNEACGGAVLKVNS